MRLSFNNPCDKLLASRAHQPADFRISLNIVHLLHLFSNTSRLAKFIAILLVALFLSVPAIRAQDSSVSAGARVAQSSESLQVWVNTASGVYHYPGTRWYGNTKQGKFMSEAEARAHGFRPALNGQ
jgi:hypothetical protein